MNEQETGGKNCGKRDYVQAVANENLPKARHSASYAATATTLKRRNGGADKE